MEAFMDQLNQVVVSLQSVMSGKVLVVLLVGTGIWFTIKLRGVQFVQFGKSLKAVFGSTTSAALRRARTVCPPSRR